MTMHVYRIMNIHVDVRLDDCTSIEQPPWRHSAIKPNRN